MTGSGAGAPAAPLRTRALLAAADRYFENDCRVVRVTYGAAELPRFEPEGVLAAEEGPECVEHLVCNLRERRWRNEPDGSALHELARGVALDEPSLHHALGSDWVDRYRSAGLLVREAPRDRLGFGVMALGDLLVPVPREPVSPDAVYLGVEALYLDAAREALGVSGPTAYLGSGAGHAAAVLATTADRLVATDLMPRAAAMTALAFAMNRGHVAPAVVVQADVGAGLRRGHFETVVANPPWVPEGDPPTGRVFADGGPTGCELPIRFVEEALGLLRPGGVAIVLTLDPTFPDGRRPIAAWVDRCNGAAGGATVAASIPTPVAELHPGFEDRMVRAHDLVAADHVAIVAVRSAAGGQLAARERVATARRRLHAAGWPPR